MQIYVPGFPIYGVTVKVSESNSLTTGSSITTGLQTISTSKKRVFTDTYYQGTTSGGQVATTGAVKPTRKENRLHA